MAEITLSTLLSEGLVQEVLGDGSVGVRGIKHDSRRVEAGDLFVAIEGIHQRGADYVSDAVARGASAVLAESPPSLPVPACRADDALVALSRIATRIYSDPTASLDVVGITGTNGKTTVAYLVESMLQEAGARPAVIGTVNFRGPAGARDATHTTPMADDLMRLARDFVREGATHLVLEVSSHALAMHRADGVRFRVAALTNLTQDHLDFHGDFPSYERAKRRLFQALAPAVSVLNLDDRLGASLARELGGELVRCSRRADAGAEIHALSWSSDREGLRAVLGSPAGRLSIASPLLGEHNLENILVALGCGFALDLDPALMVRALGKFPGAPGRLERVHDPRGVLVAVDYAHTPDALQRVLQVLRGITDRRLIVVFGCGGDRDAGKRPLMGAATAREADLLVVTSDNPRSEPPASIIEQIERGVVGAGAERIDAERLPASDKGYLVEPDRRRAIRLAIAAARKGDTVLVAGKGHETVQIIGSSRNSFDDRIEARRAIAEVVGN
jgi:UDP-N-acetylmuramoyl-L-alanyl-D-glutamate--2,6-diaminopimelate ligase